MRGPSVAVWGVVLVVTAVAFAYRLFASLGTDDALGPDGFYYAVQVRSFLEEGSFHVRDGSWALYLLAFISWMAGDVVVGVKIGCALLAALVVPAGYLLGRALVPGPCLLSGHERTATTAWPSLALALWAALSPSLSYLAAGHAKNLAAVAPLVAGAGLLALPRTTMRVVGGGALLLLAALAHKMAAALVLAGLVAAGAVVLFQAKRGRPLPGWRVVVPVVAGAGLCFAAASAWLPNLLHPSDLARLSGQIAFDGEGPLPFGFLGDRRVPRVLVAEMALGWLALVVVALGALYRPGRFRSAPPVVWVSALLLGGIAIVPWRTDIVDLGFRLALLMPLLAMVPLAFALPAPEASRSVRPAGAWAAATAALLIGAPLTPRAMNLDEQPPYDRYRELVAALPRPLPRLLIAHHGLSFLYDWETGAEAMAWAPEPELDPHEVGRIVYGLTPPEARDFQSEVAPPAADQVRPLRGLYAYTTEAGWLALLAWSRESDPDLYTRLLDERNPRQVRPAMLVRNRAFTPHERE